MAYREKLRWKEVPPMELAMESGLLRTEGLGACVSAVGKGRENATLPTIDAQGTGEKKHRASDTPAPFFPKIEKSRGKTYKPLKAPSRVYFEI